MTATRASTLEDLVAAVASLDQVVVEGTGSGRAFDCTPRVPSLVVGYSGILSWEPADQVVTAAAGTPIGALNKELKSKGQCIPWGGCPALASGGSVGGRLSQNLPHSLEAKCGNWRDWVLGVTVVRPNGTIAKAGSKAVKNVAGYDVHRLFVGARGTLGVLAEVTLRTFPLAALPALDLEVSVEKWPEQGWVQRTLRTDFELACGGADLLAAHPGTATLYAGSAGARYADDWVLGWGFGRENFSANPLMARAKQIFDPKGKLNPGELGL